jgi:hypothetical protein
MEPKLTFEDVRNCKDIEELNDFIRKYLEERGLQGEERRRTYWALIYAWKEASSLANEQQSP